MYLEGIVLRPVSHIEEKHIYDFTYMWNLKKQTKQKFGVNLKFKIKHIPRTYMEEAPIATWLALKS